MKKDSNFKLSKPVKRLLSTMSKTERILFKHAMISAELTDGSTEHFVMNYDVKVNQKHKS